MVRMLAGYCELARGKALRVIGGELAGLRIADVGDYPMGAKVAMEISDMSADEIEISWQDEHGVEQKTNVIIAHGTIVKQPEGKFAAVIIKNELVVELPSNHSGLIGFQPAPVAGEFVGSSPNRSYPQK